MEWHLEEYEAEEGRLVVDENNVLVADVYASTDTEHTVPSPAYYRRNAALIKLVPWMVESLLSMDDANVIGPAEELLTQAHTLVQFIREIEFTYEQEGP